ncbi:Threonine/homoserine/homoserine lactone efflux protein [Cohaesibacter marisflavi]|uniref:Threonine/homoserine/homoserine lactone efflux protein n=1 Tax=Cohaesibacter marisflavi TaxID=655353 RepID=A0A1I5FTG1_9HYPH|nr:LysE family translocator [Cohaesibacter marisflavi]SFO27060.1 Threonine/homoserine/homoserine lactone efflux protein [Cohaesibacter marisflavi]
MTIEFLLTSLFIVITPGTGMIFTLVVTLRRGLRMGLMAALGGTLSIISHITAAVLGLAALLHASAMAFQMVKFAGVAYLLFMAYKMLKDKEQFDADHLDDASVQGPSALGIVRDGILLNLLNPKLSIFFLAFLPQFIDVNTASPMLDMVELGSIFMVMTLLVFALVGVAAASVRDKLLSRPAVMAWLKRGFAATFVALGAKLALTQR